MGLRRFLFLLYAVLALGPPLWAQGQRSGSITSAQCVSIEVSAQSTVGIQVIGTWTGTLQPEISIQGQAPQNIQVTPSTSSVAQSTITANGVYTAKVAGGSTFLLCGATVASGTATVFLNASQAVYTTSSGGVAASVPFSGVTPGTNTGALVIGTGGTLSTSGSGTIAATSVPFSGVAAGTNPNALFVGTGGSLFPSGTGQVRSTAFVPYTTAQTAPGTVSVTGCTGQTPALQPSIWVPLADSTYAEYFCMDETVVNPPASPAGIATFNWRTMFNDSSAQINQFKNRFVSIIHCPGCAGTLADSTHDTSALGAVWDNSYPGASQSYRQETTTYMEMQISGTPTWAGHALGEVDGSSGRFNLTDSRTSGATPSILSGVSALVYRNNAGATLSTSNGTWAGIYSAAINAAGGALTGTQHFSSFVSSGADLGTCSGSGCVYIGFEAGRLPSPRFVTQNLGFYSVSFGTNAADYDMILSGVNSAGTAAGFNALVGPSAFGQQIHAASGYQTDTLGGVKIKASASAGNMLGLFGFTSGSALIGVADAAGTPNRINLPTATGSANGILQTDGASPQQTSWTLTPSLTTLALTGQFTSTLATGTAPLVIASTTNVANLNASSLAGATFAAPGAIGGGTPGSGAFTTLSATGQITSTLATGTAPLVIASTTNVANLNASSLSGATFAAPGAIGGGTPSSGAFTTLTASTGFTSYAGITTAGFGVPVQAARVRSVSQVAAIGTTTLLATGANTADYLVVGTLYCDSTSAAATVSLTISYTDSGSQAQTIAPTSAACTALGSSSFALVNSPIVAKNGTNIQYSTSIANTPTYDLRLDLYQLGSN